MGSRIFGQIGPFEPEREGWPEYAERMEYFFSANNIQGDKRKAIFLSTIGAGPYRLLRSLMSPVKPGEKSYDELVEAMSQHYCPKPSEIVQRYKFNSRIRKSHESVAEYVSQLRALAEHCNFGGSLEEMLRDRLVCGIEDTAIQRKLLAEADLTLKKAVDIALAMESAVKDAETIGETGTKVNRVVVARSLASSKPQGKSLTCYRCGHSSHKASQCKFKDSLCHHCGKKGHLKKVCRSWLQAQKKHFQVKHLAESNEPDPLPST
jgi:hypothetical protein